ncbi:MAG: DUF4347 domain-containing protein [Cyanobacteria bacterium P01_H01_bin.35]
MNQTKLLFIDSKVENYHHLISQVDSQTKIVVLEPNQNGIDKIAEHMGKACDVDTVHIISHGQKGTLYLGNSILNSDNIHLYAEKIQKWGKYLSGEAEILIYGCQVASGKEGKEFVRQLHQLTGSNIAASETMTGNVNKGGNWNLEVIFGQLKSVLAFPPEVRASYAGVLADIVVNTTEDVVDDSDGVTSLREAIIQANSTPEDDTIQLTAGATYNLTIVGSDENVAATGDLDIVAGGGEITVISEGGEKAVIDAGGQAGINDRVFHILEDGSLNLENIEVTGGIVNASGGGICNEGAVSISNSIISGNETNYIGGGIYSLFGIASISNSTISGNSAYYGGGISSLYSNITINNSTISSNSATSGGGIHNVVSTANINNSNISGNSATSGAGIHNYYGNVSINNSTISSNSATSGGGIENNFYGNVSINHSTISGNSATSGGGFYNGATAIISNSTITRNEAVFDRGSGIFHRASTVINNGNYSYSFNASTTITSSIVSGNINTDVDSVENDNNFFESGGNNLIGTGNATGVFDDENDQTDVTDPLLGDLADNGSGTLTHLPLSNSPAIDPGSNPNNLDIDQRGELRFVGRAVDIGAVEVQTSQITGTSESELLNGSGGNDTITGLAGNDTINGRGGDDKIIGSRGNDSLYGKNGNDILEGRIGNDRLFGGNGNDSLLGGQGRDRFNGGRGNDTLMGGASIDRFIFNTNQEFTPEDVGVDTIIDFVVQQDIILLDKSTFSAITSESGTGFSVNGEFAIVTSDGAAETSAAVIVYNRNNGKLFYNANGTEAEFGSGGEFANLSNIASISEDDFFLRG